VSDVYGVSAADIAAEVPGLFQFGFTQVTKPNLTTVTSWISDADAYIDGVVVDATTKAPEIADRIAQLPRRYIIDTVLVRIYRAAFAGRNPADIAALVDGFNPGAIVEQITALVIEAVALETLAESRTVSVPYTTASRDLLIDTPDLDPNSGLRGRF
jgi:hypothetical protein